MTAGELKRMRRSDLLEMLLRMRKENDQLRRELEQARQELSDRSVAIEECGSLADAVVKLNGMIEATQEACEQYTYNVNKRCKEAEERCRKLERSTKQKCDQMLIQAAQHAESIRNPQNPKTKSSGQRKSKPRHTKKKK